LICLSIDAVSQVKTGQHRSQQTATQSTDQLSQIRAALSSLNEKIEKLEEKLSIQEFLLKEKQDKREEVYLDVTQHTYQRLDTDTGFFLISVEDAVSYLNGYKIQLKLGNPSSANYAGYKLKIRWAKSYDYSKYTRDSYAEWSKSIQEREFSFTDKLESGAWNPAELILTPATPDQLGYLAISINTNTVSLHTR